MKKTFLKNNKKRLLAFLTSLSMMPAFMMPVYASTPSFDIPTNVTNVGIDAEMIEVSFDAPVDMDSLEIKAIAQEAKGSVIANGKEYTLSIAEKNEAENSFLVDIAGLPSYVKFKLDVDGQTSAEFTTGLVSKMPYVKNTAIVDVIDGLDATAIYPAVSTASHSLSTWIDRNSDTNFNFDGGTISYDENGNKVVYTPNYPNDYVVVDLGKEYEIGDLAAQLTGTMWHSGGTNFYLFNDLLGVSYDSLTGGMQLETSNTDQSEVFTNMVDHAVISESQKAKYVVLKEKLVGSNKNFLLKEVYAFARVSDSFGEWTVAENYPNIEFSIPFTYIKAPKTYTMQMTTYSNDGSIDVVETPVTGNLFEGEIPFDMNTTGAQAVIYDGESHKIVAPVAYWNFDGYNKDNGTATTFADAVSGTPNADSFTVSGKSVEETDYITVSVVSAYEDKQNLVEYSTYEAAFANEDILWQASTVSDNGYEIEAPLSGGKYFIKVIRYAKDGTEEIKYFSHKIISAEELETFIGVAMDGDEAAVEEAVLDALDDEIITTASLAAKDALDSDSFYTSYVSTRGLLYDAEGIAKVKDDNEVAPVIGLLDATAAVDYILAGDYEKAVLVIGKMSDATLIKKYVITTADAEKYNSIFAILKDKITDTEALGDVLAWSGMLASFCDDTKAALEDYESEFGIDLSILETKNVLLENVISHINVEITSENILALYEGFAAMFTAAVEKEANTVRVNIILPDGNVTNVGRDAKMIEVSFTGPVDMTQVSQNDIYAVALETKGNITKGNKYSVALVENKKNAKSVLIDIAGLPSNTQFQLAIDGISDETILSETFTTGVVANIPYVEDTVILDVAKDLPKDAIYTGVKTDKSHDLYAWIDGDSSTAFNFNTKEENFPNNYVVIDLGRKYAIGDIAAQINATPWHSGGARFYLAESLEGITYDSLSDGMSFAVANSESTASIFDNMIDHVAMSGSKTARYIILKKNVSSTYDLQLKEIFAFARVADSFGDWTVTEEGSNVKFAIPFTYAKVPKTYTMAITTYKADNTQNAHVVKSVTGELFENSVSTSGIERAQAVIYDTDLSKPLAPVAYWGFDGYNKDNGTAAKFTDAVTATPTGNEFIISGKSVSSDDYITVKTEKLSALGTIVWQASTASKNGYEFEIPFADTDKYQISVIRYANDGTTETKTFTYKKPAADKLNACVDTLIDGDASDVKAQVESAIADEIITEDYLLDPSALDDEDFYEVYEYTRDMIYTDEEKADITDNNKLTDIVDALNAAMVINAIWNGDSEEAEKLLASDAAKLIDGLSEKAKDIESYTKVFGAIKDEVSNAEGLKKAINWSTMLAPMYGTDSDRANNMTKYESEFGIDLSVIEDKGLSLERVASYMEPKADSDIVSMYNDFASVFGAAVLDAEGEQGNDSGSSGNVTNNGNNTGKDIYNSNTRPITSDRGSKGNGGGAVVAPTPAKKPSEFSDMSAYGWASDAVSKLVDEKVLNGYTDGTFRPENFVTRGEFIKMLVAATEIEVVENKTMFFLDVAEDSWYFPYIKIAYTNRLCQGVSDGYFDPHGYITRQDMAVLIYNYMKFAKMSTAGEAKSFSDEAYIAGYAKEAVEHASAAGVINGRDDGTFAPLANARRVDAAMMISKIMK